MTMPVKGCPLSQPQQEGAEGPETNLTVPQQEEQPDATKGKVIADYDPDKDFEGSNPINEPVAQEEKEEDPNAENVNLEIPCTGTFHQRMMPCNVLKNIRWVHKEQGPEILTL